MRKSVIITSIVDQECAIRETSLRFIEVYIENNEIALNNNISAGMYLITFENNSNTFSKKLMIN